MPHSPPQSSVPLLDPKVEHGADLDDLEHVSHTSTRRPSHSRLSSLGILLFILILLALSAVVVALFWPKGLKVALPIIPGPADHAQLADVTPGPAPEVASWPHSVLGRPTVNFKDNLRNDTQYVTTWVSGGWTNDFMTYINMIYLGLLTSRVPIIPPFSPSHVDYDAGFPPFGDVFDVPRLASAINATLLEWRDVKHENSSELDQLGCWSIWMLVSDEGHARDSIVPRRLKLDVAYTSLPPSSKIIEGVWLPFWTLAKLGFPSRRVQALAENPAQTPAPDSGVQIPPDERLMCFDFMYFLGAQDIDEWWDEWSPAWRFVGQHARWNPSLRRLAVGYIQRALGVDEGSDTVPPYISVHIRRGDFTAACGNIPAEKCFWPLEAYAQRVKDVSAALLTNRGIVVPARNLLVTSDETDAGWWEEVAALGWHRADHAQERTGERYGKWYLPLVDAVVQSLAVGFVGTDRSTMSLVAKRRVEDWNGGITELVPIGPRDRDPH